MLRVTLRLRMRGVRLLSRSLLRCRLLHGWLLRCRLLRSARHYGLGARSRWRQRRAALLRGIRCGVFALFILFGSMICLLWHYCHLAQSDRCLKLHLFYCKCFKHVCLTITKTMPSRKEELMEYPRVLLELSPKAQQPHICQTAFTGSFRT